MSKKSSADSKSNLPIYKKWWFWVIAAILLLGVAGALSGNNTDNRTSDNSNGGNSTSNVSEKATSNLSLGSTFKFYDLEITIGSDYSFATLSNQFSDKDGYSVIKLPVSVKNLKSETHSLNMFYTKVFGSKGVELDDISAYFSDADDINFAGELRSGASYSKFFYFLYDGNGNYVIQFAKLVDSNPIEVHFEVTK